MPLPAHNSGEYAASAEYVKEYAGLLIDIATLVENLDEIVPSKSEVRDFIIERIEEPIPVSDSISEAIGEVTSAIVSYDTIVDDPTITIELMGSERSYIAARSKTTKNPTDTVLDITPVDPFIYELLGKEERPVHIHASEHSDDFEKRINNIAGISTVEFNRLLLTLAQPNTPVDDSSETNKVLATIDPFEHSLYRKFIESSSATSQMQQARFEYEFLADDTATFTFSQENGHPSRFQFICVKPEGEKLQVHGTMARTFELEFPRHALQEGLNKDIVDTVISFPLTLSEIKYIREIFRDELESLPKIETNEELHASVDELLPTYLPLDEIDLRIENEREESALEKRARDDSIDDELAQLLSKEDDENDS